jgi:hypothetical protein
MNYKRRDTAPNSFLIYSTIRRDELLSNVLSDSYSNKQLIQEWKAMSKVIILTNEIEKKKTNNNTSGTKRRV